jgi:hypothetical protein
MEILSNVQVPTIVTNRGGLKKSAYLTAAQSAVIATLGHNQGVLLPLMADKDPSYQARVTAHRIAMEIYGRVSNDDRKVLPEYAVYVSQEADRPGIMVVRVMPI